MPAIGGSAESMSMAGRIFAIPFDADIQMKLGGTENESLANGNGTTRLIKKKTPWALNGVVVEIDHDRNDLEFLQDLANSLDYFAVEITYGIAVYQGSGQISGELMMSNQSATATFNLSGPGTLTAQ